MAPRAESDAESGVNNPMHPGQNRAPVLREVTMDRMHDEEQQSCMIRLHTAEKKLQAAEAHIADERLFTRGLALMTALWFAVSLVCLSKYMDISDDLYAVQWRASHEMEDCRASNAKLRAEAENQRVLREASDDALASMLDATSAFGGKR